MSKVLGKRKARETEQRSPAELEAAQEIFRRHFEAQFKPLAIDPIRPLRQTEDNEDDTESESGESEWEGIAEDEDEEDSRVEVIDHASAQKPISSMTKSELKKFMSSRIPSSEPTPSLQTIKTTPSDNTQDEDAPSLLANDLALQRLLSESSLLSRAMLNPMFYPTNSSGTQIDPSARAFAAGRLRLATTDLRMRALGSKESIFTQGNVPLAIKRGIQAAAAGKEAKRRREAKENGIVLEREEKKDTRKRRRGGGGGGDVDLPAVGRLRGAELKISKRDVMSIQGSPGGGMSRGRGGRGGGRGGGGGGRGGKKRY